MREQTEVTIGDVVLAIEYTYEKGENRNWDYAGSPPQVFIETIFVADSLYDIHDMLESTSLYDEIKTIIIEKHE